MKIQVLDEQYLIETSFSRVLQHANEGQLAFITAWKDYYSRAENSKKNKELSNDLRESGLSFSKCKGGFVETEDKDGQPLEEPVEVTEQTYIVYNNKFTPEDFRKYMVNLCGKYKQDAVLITDPYYTDDTGRDRSIQYARGNRKYDIKISAKYYDKNGHIVSKFSGITLNDVEQYFSSIFNKKFTFTEEVNLEANFNAKTNTPYRVQQAVSNFRKVENMKDN